MTSHALIEPLCHQYYMDCDVISLSKMVKTSKNVKGICQQYLNKLREEYRFANILLEGIIPGVTEYRVEFRVTSSKRKSVVIPLTRDEKNDEFTLLRYIHRYGVDFDVEIAPFDDTPGALLRLKYDNNVVDVKMYTITDSNGFKLDWTPIL